MDGPRFIVSLLFRSAGPLILVLMGLDLLHARLIRPASETLAEAGVWIALSTVLTTGLALMVTSAEALLASAYSALNRLTARRYGHLAAPLMATIGASPLLLVLARQPFVGNRYRDSQVAVYGPWIVVAALAAVTFLGVWLGAKFLWWLASSRASRGRRGAATVLLGTALLGIISLDTFWYAGWYPLIHTVLSVGTAVIAHVLLVVALFRSDVARTWAKRASVGVACLAVAAAIVAGALATNGAAWRVATGTLFAARAANPLLQLQSGALTVSELNNIATIQPKHLVQNPGTTGVPSALASDGLLITVDSLRFDAIGPHEGKTLTPAIDAFFSAGQTFERAYSQYASTRHSVRALLESRFRDDGRPVSDDLINRLRDFGFRVYAVLPTDLKTFVNVERYNFTGVTFYEDPSTIRSALRALTTGSPAEKRFVWVHLYQPHDPYEPPRELRSGTRARDLYNGEVRWVDRQFSEITKDFASGSTIVIFGADHGEEFGEHGGTLHGRTGYDETLRVPLAVRVTGVPPSRRSELVANVDVAPTTLAALGVPIPDRFEGYDLLRRASTAPTDRVVFAETVTNAVVAVQGWYKWVHWTDQDLWEAYDLGRDPAERRNLAEDPDIGALGRFHVATFEWPWRTLPQIRRMDAASFHSTLRLTLAGSVQVNALARMAVFRGADGHKEEAGVRALLEAALETETEPVLKASLLDVLGDGKLRRRVAATPDMPTSGAWLALLRHAPKVDDGILLVQRGRQHPVAAVRALASEQWARRDPSGAETVLMAKSPPEPATRRGLLTGLASRASNVSAATFQRFLDDPDADARVAALEGLCAQGGPGAVALLTARAAMETSPTVARVAIERLLERDRTAGIAAVQQEIARRRLSDAVQAKLIADWQVLEAAPHLLHLFSNSESGAFRLSLFQAVSQLKLPRQAVVGLLREMHAGTFEPSLRARIGNRLQELESQPTRNEHHEPTVPGQP